MATCLNIVVVEDHDDLREVTVEMLCLNGHNARGLACAEAIDDELGSVPVDLLIADLNLPGEDGLSLARRFRAAHPLAGIIMVTARNGTDDKVDGYQSGADAYLPKPVAPAELLGAVEALARRLVAPPAGNVLGAPAGLQLNSRNLQLHGPAGVAEVSAAEAALLAALARAPGQRLDTWQMMEVLGMTADANNKRSLEVRIVRMRKKMTGVGADAQCVRVLRLHGYQLCVPLQVF